MQDIPQFYTYKMTYYCKKQKKECTFEMYSTCESVALNDARYILKQRHIYYKNLKATLPPCTP